jgi:hypothetical protein
MSNNPALTKDLSSVLSLLNVEAYLLSKLEINSTPWVLKTKLLMLKASIRNKLALKLQDTLIKLAWPPVAVRINFLNWDLTPLTPKFTDTTSRVRETSSRFTSKELSVLENTCLTTLPLPLLLLEWAITLPLLVKSALLRHFKEIEIFNLLATSAKIAKEVWPISTNLKTPKPVSLSTPVSLLSPIRTPR